VKASSFSAGAENLVVIGRAGAGYDKIDLEACTANDVAVFYSPDTLTHSTASAALLFMLALANPAASKEWCFSREDRLSRGWMPWGCC
jgi:phosphoglycerate dehydrogenase-like enzyme